MGEVPTRLVLVTGGTGYVGSVLVPLVAQRYPVRVFCSMHFGNAIAGTPNVEFIKGDIQDPHALAAALLGVTDVIHLAGIVTDALVDMNQEMGMKVNQHATGMLCRLALDAGVKRLLYASSSSVYGTTADPATETTPVQPMTAYADSKLQGEMICLGWKDKMVVSAVRCATCAGPAPRMRLDTIVNIFCKQAYFDGKITVHGGSQYRSNVHVRDAAALYLHLLDAPAEKINGQVFNLTRENMTAIGIAEKVQRALWETYAWGIPWETYAKEIPIEVDATKPDNRHYRMDAGNLKRVLGWEPVFSIWEAIMDNFRWFESGKLGDPNSSLYYNTERMKEVIKAG